jgi:hypothetical protein
MGTRSFPGVKSSQGVMLTPHPLLVPWSGKSRAIPLLPLWAVRPVEPQCLYKGAPYLFLHPLVESLKAKLNLKRFIRRKYNTRIIGVAMYL